MESPLLDLRSEEQHLIAEFFFVVRRARGTSRAVTRRGGGGTGARPSASRTRGREHRCTSLLPAVAQCVALDFSRGPPGYLIHCSRNS